MTLEEAIEVLTDDLVGLPETIEPELNEAVKLGIKALQRLWLMREDNILDALPHLQGETGMPE